MIPGSANPLLLKSAAAAAGGYQVSRSLRFNSSDSAFCSRTPAVAGNRRTFTWAGWIKRSNLDSRQIFFGPCPNSGNYFLIEFSSNNSLVISGNWSNYPSSYLNLVTTAVYRDTSAWYHVVVKVDTTVASASGKCVLYVNGVEITDFSTDTRSSISQNQQLECNNTVPHNISGQRPYSSNDFNGYLADIHFIDGQALTPSSFTEVSATTGQLEPKAYTGSFGTNGFWLKFSDNSATTAATLGKDYSGNSNNWTPNNFSVLNSPQRWSRYFSVVGGGSSNVNGTELQAFDSSESTSNGYSGALLPSNYLLWSSPTTFSNAAVRVRVNQGDLGTATLEVNGASRTITNAQGVHWEDFGTLSTFNFIKLGLNSQPSNGTYIYAVEVNGSLLIDSVFNSANDSLVDSPTSYGTDTGAGGEVRGNYCTWNPLDTSGGTLTNGNLDLATGTATYGGTRGTVSVSSGKWYWEVTPTAMTTSAELVGIGICASTVTLPSYAGAGTLNYTYMNDGQKRVPGSDTNYGATYTVNDVIGVALDLDAGTLVFYKNGASQGTAFSSLSGSFAPYASDADAAQSCTVVANFGQRAFAYTAPSGFKALCTQNLPSPLIAKPNTVMDVKLYTGNGSTQTISGLGFSPDWVWVKSRSAATGHKLIDSVRGATFALAPGGSFTTDTNGLTAFTSDGFSLGTDTNYNNTSATYVGWCWDTGGTTTTETSPGTVSVDRRVNVSAGFSVAKFTSAASGNFSIAHGLGVAPSFVLISAATTYHASVCTTTSNYFNFQSTTGLLTYSTIWGAALPTSSVVSMTVGGAVSANQANVAYCFAPVVGYSSFGSYTGNGSTNGPFVYTGFRPRWVLIKKSSGTENWRLHDTARSSFNVMQSLLFPNLSQAETTNAEYNLDVLSNGFKIRTNVAGSMNDSGATYIYAAFAESPFQYARAR